MGSLSDVHRMAYAFYMGGLTFGQVGDVLGVSDQRAMEIVRVADRHLELVIRARERELHRESPRQWHSRDPLLVREDLSGSYYGGEAVGRHVRPVPHDRPFVVHHVVPFIERPVAVEDLRWKISCSIGEPAVTFPNPRPALPRDQGSTLLKARVTCAACSGRG